MRISTAPQRSDQWYADRLGRCTSSRADDFLATLKKGGEAKGRQHYKLQLALERINGRSYEKTFQSEAMLTGIQRESDALSAYETQAGELITRVGFCAHDTLLAGGSPDGLIGDDGGVEVKAPMALTHLETLKTQVIPLEYRRQMTHLLWLTGAAWWDFASFCPEFPAALQLTVVRFTISPQERTDHDMAVEAFLTEVEMEVSAIQRLAARPVSLHDQLAASLAHEQERVGA